MTIRHGRESALNETIGRFWPASITVRSSAWRARGISPLESRIWTVETGTAAGAGAGAGAAWRSVARRANAVITGVLYGPGEVDVRYNALPFVLIARPGIRKRAPAAPPPSPKAPSGTASGGGTGRARSAAGSASPSAP